MPTTTQPNALTENGTTIGTTIPFDAITEPGCYICNWSGHLLRVPQDGVAPGRAPLINLIGHDTLFVTQLSTNPFITVTKARTIASNLDLAVNF
jgi:hypothetical protein